MKFGFHSKCSKKLREIFKMGSDMVLLTLLKDHSAMWRMDSRIKEVAAGRPGRRQTKGA